MDKLHRSLQWKRAILLFVIIFLVIYQRVQSAPLFFGSFKSPKDKGCYYLMKHYKNGEQIETNEPCLNCTCSNSMLMCYLRVCPYLRPFGENCTVNKISGQCCPEILCPDVPDPEPGIELFPDPEPDPEPILKSKIETATFSTAKFEPQDGTGCNLDGQYYLDGAQLPVDPTKSCEICYCIRNRSACAIQDCTLNVSGCFPIHAFGRCCPIRYNCTSDAATTVPPGQAHPIKETLGCYANGKFYSDGEQVKSLNPCEHCYCMRNEVVCAIQKCKAPCEGCVPIHDDDDQCCPKRYECYAPTVTSRPFTTDILFETTFEKPTTLSPKFENISLPFETTKKVTEAPTRIISELDMRQDKTRQDLRASSSCTKDEKRQLHPNCTQTTLKVAEDVTKESILIDTTELSDNKTEDMELIVTESTVLKLSDFTSTKKSISESVTMNPFIRKTSFSTEPKKDEYFQQPDIKDSLNKKKPVSSSSTTPGEGICRYKGKIYQSGEKVQKDDPCLESCVCVNNLIFCDRVICKPKPEEKPGTRCELIEFPKSCCPSYNCYNITGAKLKNLNKTVSPMTESTTINKLITELTSESEDLSITGIQDYTQPIGTIKPNLTTKLFKLVPEKENEMTTLSLILDEFTTVESTNIKDFPASTTKTTLKSKLTTEKLADFSTKMSDIIFKEKEIDKEYITVTTSLPKATSVQLETLNKSQPSSQNKSIYTTYKWPDEYSWTTEILETEKTFDSTLKTTKKELFELEDKIYTTPSEKYSTAIIKDKKAIEDKMLTSESISPESEAKFTTEKISTISKEESTQSEIKMKPLENLSETFTSMPEKPIHLIPKMSTVINSTSKEIEKLIESETITTEAMTNEALSIELVTDYLIPEVTTVLEEKATVKHLKMLNDSLTSTKSEHIISTTKIPNEFFTTEKTKKTEKVLKGEAMTTKSLPELITEYSTVQEVTKPEVILKFTTPEVLNISENKIDQPDEQLKGFNKSLLLQDTENLFPKTVMPEIYSTIVKIYENEKVTTESVLVETDKDHSTIITKPEKINKKLESEEMTVESTLPKLITKPLIFKTSTTSELQTSEFEEPLEIITTEPTLLTSSSEFSFPEVMTTLKQALKSKNTTKCLESLNETLSTSYAEVVSKTTQLPEIYLTSASMEKEKINESRTFTTEPLSIILKTEDLALETSTLLMKETNDIENEMKNLITVNQSMSSPVTEPTEIATTIQKEKYPFILTNTYKPIEKVFESEEITTETMFFKPEIYQSTTTLSTSTDTFTTQSDSDLVFLNKTLPSTKLYKTSFTSSEKMTVSDGLLTGIIQFEDGALTTHTPDVNKLVTMQVASDVSLNMSTTKMPETEKFFEISTQFQDNLVIGLIDFQNKTTPASEVTFESFNVSNVNSPKTDKTSEDESFYISSFTFDTTVTSLTDERELESMTEKPEETFTKYTSAQPPTILFKKTLKPSELTTEQPKLNTTKYSPIDLTTKTLDSKKIIESFTKDNSFVTTQMKIPMSTEFQENLVTLPTTEPTFTTKVQNFKKGKSTTGNSLDTLKTFIISATKEPELKTDENDIEFDIITKPALISSDFSNTSNTSSPKEVLETTTSFAPTILTTQKKDRELFDKVTFTTGDIISETFDEFSTEATNVTQLKTIFSNKNVKNESIALPESLVTEKKILTTTTKSEPTLKKSTKDSTTLSLRNWTKVQLSKEKITNDVNLNEEDDKDFITPKMEKLEPETSSKKDFISTITWKHATLDDYFTTERALQNSFQKILTSTTEENNINVLEEVLPTKKSLETTKEELNENLTTSKFKNAVTKDATTRVKWTPVKIKIEPRLSTLTDETLLTTELPIKRDPILEKIYEVKKQSTENFEDELFFANFTTITTPLVSTKFDDKTQSEHLTTLKLEKLQKEIEKTTATKKPNTTKFEDKYLGKETLPFIGDFQESTSKSIFYQTDDHEQLYTYFTTEKFSKEVTEKSLEDLTTPSYLFSPDELIDQTFLSTVKDELLISNELNYTISSEESPTLISTSNITSPFFVSRAQSTSLKDVESSTVYTLDLDLTTVKNVSEITLITTSDISITSFTNTSALEHDKTVSEFSFENYSTTSEPGITSSVDTTVFSEAKSCIPVKSYENDIITDEIINKSIPKTTSVIKSSSLSESTSPDLKVTDLIKDVETIMTSTLQAEDMSTVTTAAILSDEFTKTYLDLADNQSSIEVKEFLSDENSTFMPKIFETTTVTSPFKDLFSKDISQTFSTTKSTTPASKMKISLFENMLSTSTKPNHTLKAFDLESVEFITTETEPTLVSTTVFDLINETTEQTDYVKVDKTTEKNLMVETTSPANLTSVGVIEKIWTEIMSVLKPKDDNKNVTTLSPKMITLNVTALKEVVDNQTESTFFLVKSDTPHTTALYPVTNILENVKSKEITTEKYDSLLPINIKSKSTHQPCQSDLKSEYDVQQIEETRECVYEGYIYQFAEQIPRKNACEFCFCYKNDIICLQQTCPPPIENCTATNIEGFCCPRYQCPVDILTVNVTTTTTTTTTTNTPIVVNITKPITGCEIDGNFFEIGQIVEPASGPCLECRCESNRHMNCNPKKCEPEKPFSLKIDQKNFKIKK